MTFYILSLLGRSLRYVRSKSPLLQADSILLTSSQLLNNVVLFFSCRESSLVSIISTVEAHKPASSSSENTRQMMIYARADMSWGALRPSESLRFPPFSRPAFIIGFTAYNQYDTVHRTQLRNIVLSITFHPVIPGHYSQLTSFLVVSLTFLYFHIHSSVLSGRVDLRQFGSSISRTACAERLVRRG